MLMIQRNPLRRNVLLSLTCLIVVSLLQLLPAIGAPPSGGGGGDGSGTHTSLIYFYYQNAIYQMYQDGSGKAQALPAGVFGRPSSRIYDGSRWWLMLQVVDELESRQELFAFNQFGDSVQLTNTASSNVRLEGTPQWSADRNDTFVSLHARMFLEVGDRGGEDVIRLPLRGDQIAGIAAGALPRLTAADVEFVLPPSPVRPDHRTAYA